MRRVGRLEQRLARMRGKPRYRRARRMLRWYLGLHDRWSLEAELGRQPVMSAIRNVYEDEGRR